LYINHKAGDELLQDLLNTGILGFMFKDKNQVTLVGPGVEGVRLSAYTRCPAKSHRELKIKYFFDC